MARPAPEATSNPTRTDPPRWPAAVLLPLLAGAAALAVSWQCWINPLVDSGRDLDVAWRLALGERLYRDVTFYYGPFGPWLDCLALNLLGYRFLSLEILCLALAAGSLGLLFALTRRAGSFSSALFATALAAAFCLGAPNGGAFIFPYSSSSLLALCGALVALLATSGGGPDGPAARTSSWARRGLAAGGLALALGARLEVGMAAAAVLVAAALGSPNRRGALREALAAVAGGCLAAGAAYGLACAGLPLQDVVADGPLKHFLGLPPEWRALYWHVLGLERPRVTVERFAGALLLDGLILWACARFALPHRRQEGDGRAARPPWFALAVALCFVAYGASRWCVDAQNLPPVVMPLPAIAAVAAAATALRSPLAGRERDRFLLFGFSAALAARVAFGLTVGPRMSPYAALPLPALLASATVMAWDLLAPRLGAPAVFRRRLAAILTLFAALFLYRLQRLDQAPRRVRLSTPAGTLRLPEPEAAAIGEALDFLNRHARSGETLAAFPEGGFFNFVSGLRSPLRQDQIFPGVLDVRRESAAAERLVAGRPRYVLLLNRPTAEYGPTSFGLDYATRLWREVERHYALHAVFGLAQGDAPVGAKPFFIRLYERLPRAPGG
jgi:hypothetical protein